MSKKEKFEDEQESDTELNESNDLHNREVQKKMLSCVGLKLAVIVAVIFGVTLGAAATGKVIESWGANEAEVAEEAENQGEKANTEPGTRAETEAKSEGSTGNEAGTAGNDETNSGAKAEPEVKQEPAPEQNVRPATSTEVNPPETQGRKLVALTFDDGPSAATTNRLLDILNQKGVKVTFFVLGNLAEKSPELVLREAREGHEVASHTPAHRNLSKMNAAQVRAEAEEMNRIFVKILGKTPPFTRPPYGAQNQTVRSNMNQPLILWTVDPEDWKYRNAGTVRNKVTTAVFDGAIVLMHDIHASTVDAVPTIIDDLRARGYEFLTVSELAKVRNVALANGGVYGSFRP